MLRISVLGCKPSSSSQFDVSQGLTVCGLQLEICWGGWVQRLRSTPSWTNGLRVICRPTLRKPKYIPLVDASCTLLICSGSQWSEMNPAAKQDQCTKRAPTTPRAHVHFDKGETADGRKPGHLCQHESTLSNFCSHRVSKDTTAHFWKQPVPSKFVAVLLTTSRGCTKQTVRTILCNRCTAAKCMPARR